MYSIALDGPGGAGKSTIAKQVAKRRGIVYVDTGAMYRAIALYMLKNNVDIHNEELVVSQLENVDIRLEYREGAQCVILNGEDVSTAIRENEVSMAASVTSAYKQVRAFLMDTQRNVAKTTSVIMDGRDIGTVVLPDAQVKIFLSADSRVRAQRRFAELQAKGDNTPFEEVLADIEKRDWQDTHRKEAPLRQADDAVLLDTSFLDFEQAVQAVLNIIDEKVK
ncbi:MAG: (d)CMP kinase [Oscillospiraceae bacterium]|nr:(d)CMP kinase [Oscillospiraceae bacterium]MBQ6850396.1 (d)CMP kinase [Oscillospiraceae bacterium]MBR6609968.1 (d)CMP kinase [Oscillospiraceae bacterium]